MSRILIKNLPPSLKLNDFKTHFSTASSTEKGFRVTDAKLPTKKDGTFRRFGFIGYKTADEAKKAQEWFNNTFFGTCRIHVEVVEDGVHIERPVKKPRLENLVKDDTVTNKAKSQAKAKNDEDDPLLAEFLEVMKPRRKDLPIWADEPVPPATQKKNEQKKGKGKDHLIQPMENQEPEHAEPVSDLDWLKSKMTSTAEVEPEKAFFQDEDEKPNNGAPSPSEKEDEVPEATKTILSTARLFVRNLTFSVTDLELQELFAPFGDIEQVHIPKTKAHEGKGVAYVRFKHAPHALHAYEELDGRTFQGRLLHILPALDRNPRPEAFGKTNVKERQLEGKKKQAQTGGTWDWGALYMNSDAVASSVASRFNVDKNAILGEDDDPSSSSTNPAVKLALAETHIIQETKKFLMSEGIHIDAFSTSSQEGRKPPKSATTLLIKNIPYGTSDTTLRDMFSTHGNLVRLLVPPAGTIAVVDYDDASGADSAIKYLSYRRIGNSVLYIERAPGGVWATTAETSHTRATLFVKNLSFNTSTEAMIRAFRSLSEFVFARVATKADPKNPNGKLSMGYGFVGFQSAEAAQRGLKSMDGHVLDGHKLVVTFAGRGVEGDHSVDEKKGVGKSRTTKMMVKNVPFEATKKDIRQLFSAYGQLKSVRLPKRFDNRARGFAFLEFTTRTEAEQAMAALKHTHLLGRHLVLEWAEDEGQDLDKLREKVGIGYGEGKALPGKKRKLQMEEDGSEEE